jgi:CheY-like chemotaxis protein/predicted phosphodiesterase
MIRPPGDQARYGQGVWGRWREDKDSVPQGKLVADADRNTTFEGEEVMSKPMILLADNNEDYSKSLRRLLEEEGYLAEEAASVEEAKQKLETIPLDLALLDLRLTNDEDEYDTSGLEVAKKATEAAIPCIIITAFPSVEATRLDLRSRSIEPPLAVDFIPKAGGPQAILQALKSAPFLGHSTLLHVSDLHFRSPGEDLPYDQERSLRALKEDLENLRMERKIGRITAMIISGDIVFKGQEGGFEAAWAFLNGLCTELKICPRDTVLVPGNHDINRAKAGEEWERLPTDRRQDDILLSKFEDYLNFTTYFYGEAAFTSERVYRVFDFGKVAIVAFNSCYREGNPLYKCRVCEDEHYHGWIDKEQVGQAIGELDDRFAGREVLRLGVCHHHALPKGRRRRGCGGDHLWNYDDFLRYALAEADIRILLHGHRHRARLLQPSTPGTRMPYTFGSGTLLLARGSRAWEKNQYLILDFGPHPGKSRVIMRRYEPSMGNRLGDWTADDSVRIGGILELPDVALPAHSPL